VVLNTIVVAGVGAVSPAGWGADSLRMLMATDQSLPVQDMARPGWERPLRVRRVPAPMPRPPFLAEARLRRSPPIAQFVVGAAMEALGTDVALVRSGAVRLGIVVCTMCGCVSYSRRFYDETLRDASTASPLLFPETVFNAPGSHLAALLDSTGMNYTLVGDQATFLHGIALAADWIESGLVDAGVVVGAEELDWVVPDAQRHFARKAVLSEGAGALYLRRGHGQPGAIELRGITGAHLYRRGVARRIAAERMRDELLGLGPAELLCDGLQGVPLLDATELELWRGWTGDRLSPAQLVGEGFLAGSAWRCVLGTQAMTTGSCRSVAVSVVGCNEQAIGAGFEVCI
jgi:hypothetical protein